jgi:uncharacterized protein (TIGR01777 family)
MKKSVGIVGASGMIGAALAESYERDGWEVIRFSRTVRVVEGEVWELLNAENLKGLSVLVNLAGERIDQAWSEANKKKFYESRVGLTASICSMMEELEKAERPEVWVNASAVGIYGDSGYAELDEESAAAGDYLATLCREWEEAAEPSEQGVRTVCVRIGVVLGPESAAWKKMATVFRYGLGGKLGNGKQWFPWVHLDDIVGGIQFLAAQPTASGAFNLVAPEPVTNETFTQALASELGRPAILPVPRFALKLTLGDFSSALLASQKVSSQKLSNLGYKWQHNTLKSALESLCAK